MIRFGVVGGLISITLGLLNWFTVAQAYGPRASQIIGYLTVVLALMCIPLGIKYYRDRKNHGQISFGEALKIALGITVVFAIVSYLYSLIFFWLAGDRFEDWRNQGMTEAERYDLQQKMLDAPSFVNAPWFQSLILFISILLIGIVISLLSAALLRQSGDDPT